jgi:hypothetical protein
MPDTPAIEAKIHLKPESEGGRYSPISIGYCPHLVVPSVGEYLGVYLTAILSSKEENIVRPGEWAWVELSLMYYGNVSYEDIERGLRFEIREGATVVGTGSRTKLLWNDVLNAQQPEWTPKSELIGFRDISTLAEFHSVMVVHCGAAWNGYDLMMDSLLQVLKPEFADFIGFYAADFDDFDGLNWIWHEEWKILNLPALVVFVKGKWTETLIGLRSIEELRAKFQEWLTIAHS